MGLESECLKFRQEYDAGQRSGEAALHCESCQLCQHWCRQIDGITAMSADLSQFDVPERLTQQILLSVDKHQAAAPGLLVPLALICVAASLTISPVDSMEGILSTLLSVAAVAVLQILIRAATPEEVTT